MKLTDIRVRNFRSIEGEQHFPIPGKMTVVGPNNSGKTNILRAIQVLFTGQDNNFGYQHENDLTFGAGRVRTSITATFDGDFEDERDIYDSFDELHALQGTVRSGTQISLTLYFTESNTPVYSFFPNVKRPAANAQAAQYSRTHISLLNRLLGKFSLHYVPSAKSVDQIYDGLVRPFLRRKVAKVIAPHLPAIEESLDDAAKALNGELIKANLNGFTASFSLPKQSIEELVSGFDFMIADPHKTPVHEKGMGIQTTALLAAFRWITLQERFEGSEVIWLLEEPESYLHPDLAANCSVILDNLAADSTVIKTTHSMAFVPQDPTFVCGTVLNEKGRTEISRYRTFTESITAIRSALGIKFGDFYNLASYNIFVEGPSDRRLFSWLLTKLPEDLYPLANVRKAEFADFGGITHLSGFLRATYQFIRSESPCVSVFDGDEARDRERRALQGYFGKHGIPFEANLHFVSIRSGFAIEGMFPDEWISAIYEIHPEWFESYSVDALGALEPFRIKDDKKAGMQELLVEACNLEGDLDWAEKFVKVLQVIDQALGKIEKTLAKPKKVTALAV